MNIGDTFTARDHEQARKNQYRVEKITDGNISAVNTKDGAANQRGGYQPRIYLTPVNIEAMKRLGWLTEETNEQAI